MEPSSKIYVGVDVSKDRLDVALRPTGAGWSFPNEQAGIDALVSQLLLEEAPPPTLVVLEATGGFERPLAAALAATGMPVVVVNPRQARDFARATGRLAKTESHRRRDPRPFRRGGAACRQAHTRRRSPRVRRYPCP